MALAVRVTGLDAHGVELFSPTRPVFDELARPPLGERIADVGLRLKPMRRHADKDIPPLLKQAIRLDPLIIRRG